MPDEENAEGAGAGASGAASGAGAASAGGSKGIKKAVLMLRPLAVGHFASQAAHADLAHQLAMSRRSANRRGGERKLFLSTSLKIFAKKLKARAAWLVFWVGIPFIHVGAD